MIPQSGFHVAFLQSPAWYWLAPRLNRSESVWTRPRKLLLHELREIDTPFPLILKSANAVRDSGGRLTKGRFWICGNSLEMEAAISDWAGENPVLVQPFILGTGEGIFGLATNVGVRA